MSTAEENIAAASGSLGHRELRGVAEGNEYRISVEADHFSWVLDEPIDKGGTAQGPTPVQSFLGALMSCFTVSFQFAARRKGVPIDRIECWVAANDQKYIESIALELQVWSTAPEDEVRELLQRAERGCFVRNVLKPEVELSVDLVVFRS